MKRILMLTILSIGFSACSSAENTNVSNKNTNANYNQNTALQQIRNKIQKPANNRQRDINAVQQQIEQGSSNSANQNGLSNVKKDNLHELQHAPETR